jgi:sugar O-acyltransferase (sialic acid O-acetyltransferase NeuD family)
MSASRPLIVVGGGELSRVVIETARAQGFNVLGFVDHNPCEQTAQRLGLPRLGSDDDLRSFTEANLVLGVGCTSVNPARETIVKRISAPPHRWATIIHPHADVSPTAELAEGVVVLAGAVVCSGARIGAHCIINLGVKIDHDVSVGSFVHIAPQVAVGGGASVGDGAYVGMGAVVRDHIRVGERTMIGMGAVVTRQFEPGTVLVGVPAKPLR